MNNDGFLDVVHLGTEGLVFVYNRNATVQPLWNGVRYTTLTSGASESSPVVADINADGFNDVVCGGEEGQLTALSGAIWARTTFSSAVAMPLAHAAASHVVDAGA